MLFGQFIHEIRIPPHQILRMLAA